MNRLRALLACCCMLAPLPGYAQSNPGAAFTTAARGALLDGISSALGDYIFPGVAQRVRARLTVDRPRLTAISDPQQFADAVSDDLHQAGNDRHLNLVYSADETAPEQDPTPAEITHDNRLTVLHNAGVRSAQWLPGNIGYIRISGFPGDTPGVRQAIDAAMAGVANTDALIIDLRKNGGGDPDSLDYWMGYFFATSTELTSIRWTTPKPHVDRQFSAARIGGNRYLKPIYVLTSSHTFSCAEQFTYDLKALRRATIVGEVTGGGANPGDFRRLSDHFAVFIPTGQAYNPYTKTNWEHTGITPDVRSSSAQALVSAYTVALKSDTDSFDTLVYERAEILKNPAGVLGSIFSP